MQPALEQLHVAPAGHLIVQPPPAQLPMVQVSYGPQERVQLPPGQSWMTRVEGAGLDPMGSILQPPSVHMPMVHRCPR